MIYYLNIIIYILDGTSQVKILKITYMLTKELLNTHTIEFLMFAIANNI